MTKKAIMVQNTKKKTPARARPSANKAKTSSKASKPKVAPEPVPKSARRKNRHTYTEEKPLRVVELFSGIGAQNAALTKAGIPHETVAICDIDEKAVGMYRAIYGEDIPNLGDISKVDRLPDCDLLTYSFPCQSLSKAGQRKGMAKGSGTTSSLVWEVGRLLDEADSRGRLPEELLMENVPAIKDRNNIVNFEQWIKALHEKGYTSSYDIVNAKDHGIPQNRERCFMVSSLHNGRFIFPEKRPLNKTLGDFLEEDVPEEYYLSQERVDTYHRHKVRHQAKGSGLYYRPVNADSIAHTVTLSPSRDGANFLVEAGECEGVRASPRLRLDGMLGEEGYEIVRRVYDPEGLSPTINTAQGGGRVPKIIEKQDSRNRRRARARCPMSTRCRIGGATAGSKPARGSRSRRRSTARCCTPFRPQIRRANGSSTTAAWRASCTGSPTTRPRTESTACADGTSDSEGHPTAGACSWASSGSPSRGGGSDGLKEEPRRR